MKDFIDPRDARKLFPSGPHCKTVLRWIKSGIRDPRGRRVRLRHTRSCIRLFTTRRWVADFIEQTTAARVGGRRVK
jgi:hypothetical protein